MRNSILVLAALSLVPSCGFAQLLEETFDSAASSSNFSAALGSGSDFAVTYGFDYSTLTIPAAAPAPVGGTPIPEAPSSPGTATATRGLAFQVNTTAGVAQSVCVFTNQTFTNDFEVEVDVFFFHDNNSGSTEDPVVAINTSGTKVAAVRVAGNVAANDADGYILKHFGDSDVVAQDYYLVNGAIGVDAGVTANHPGLNWTDGLEAGIPGRQSADALLQDNTLGYEAGDTAPGGAFRWAWNTVKFRYENDLLTLSLNGVEIATYDDPADSFTSGKVALGHEDSFGGSNAGNYMIFDNLVVTEIVPVITLDVERTWNLYE